MKAMATLLGGNETAALEQVKRAGFDPEFIAVYRNNSVSALCDVLEANYMAVHNLVGDDFFLQLVKRHIKKSPARQRSLVDYGDGFEALVSAAGDEHKLPYLTDVTRLDRAWTLAHVAADARPLEISALTKLAEAGEDLEGLNLTLMPGATLLKLDWPVFDIWQSIRKEEALGAQIKLLPQTQYVLVWRYQYVVSYRVLEPAEYNFLSAIADGESLGAAMNSAIISLPSEADMTRLLPNSVGANLFQALA